MMIIMLWITISVIWTMGSIALGDSISNLWCQVGVINLLWSMIVLLLMF